MDIGALDVYTIEPTLDPIIRPYYRPTAVQAKRRYLLISQVGRYCLLHLKSSIVQYLLTLQERRNCLLPFKSIVSHEITDKSGRTCWMT